MPERAPRLVHVVWLGSDIPPRVELLRCDILHHDPGMSVRVWTDADLDWLENRELLDREERFPAKADIARYEVLKRFGGLYLDADFRVHRSLEPILAAVDTHGLVVARQNRTTYSNGVIGAAPEHPLLMDLVQRIPDTYRWTGAMTAPATTGPHFLTERLLAHLRAGGVAHELPQHAVLPWHSDEDPLPPDALPDSVLMSHGWASMDRRWSWEEPDAVRTTVAIPDRRSRIRRYGGGPRARAAASPTVHRLVANAESMMVAPRRIGSAATPPTPTAAMLEAWTARRVRRSLRGSACFLDIHPASHLPFLTASGVLDRPGRAIVVLEEDRGAPTDWTDESTRCSVHVIRTDSGDPDRVSSVQSVGAPLRERDLSRAAPPLGIAVTTDDVTLPTLIAEIPRFDLVRVRADRLTPELARTLLSLMERRRIARLLITLDPADVAPGVEDALRLVADLERSGCSTALRPWLLEGRGRTWRQHLRVATRPFILDVMARRRIRGAAPDAADAGRFGAPEVLVLVDHADIGGGTTVATALTEQWRADGRRVHLTALAAMSPQVRDRGPAPVTTALEAEGHLGRLRRLRSHLADRAGPDTVMLAIGEYPALVAVLARATLPRLRRMRIVLAEHQPHSLGEVLNRRSGVLGRLPATIVRALRRGTAASVFLSEQHRDELIARGIEPSANAVVIPNPCVVPVASEAAIAARIARSGPGRPFRLLAIGSLNAAKGHDVLLRALATLEDRFTLTIVGSGEESTLTALAEELGIGGRVALLGTRLDVAELMDEHDLFVLPSRYESFGLVVIEAIVRGMPVVATACNPTLPVLAGRIASLRVTPVDDVAALAAAIESAAATAWSVGDLLRDARACAAEHDPARAAAAHLALFERIGAGVGLSR